MAKSKDIGVDPIQEHTQRLRPYNLWMEVLFQKDGEQLELPGCQVRVHSDSSGSKGPIYDSGIVEMGKNGRHKLTIHGISTHLYLDFVRSKRDELPNFQYRKSLMEGLSSSQSVTVILLES